jgi:hypothetical protein
MDAPPPLPPVEQPGFRCHPIFEDLDGDHAIFKGEHLSSPHLRPRARPAREWQSAQRGDPTFLKRPKLGISLRSLDHGCTAPVAVPLSSQFKCGLWFMDARRGVSVRLYPGVAFSAIQN